MKLALPQPPDIAYRNAAVAWMERSFAVGAEQVAKPGVELRLACWHRAYVLRGNKETRSGDDPANLHFAYWCCLVLEGEKVLGRLGVTPSCNGQKPQVVNQSTGLEVERWVLALSEAQVTPDPEDAPSLEPALLLVPEAMAACLLLLPQSGEFPIHVWSTIRSACACSKGLHTFKEFLQSCASRPNGQLAQELATTA